MKTNNNVGQQLAIQAAVEIIIATGNGRLDATQAPCLACGDTSHQPLCPSCFKKRGKEGAKAAVRAVWAAVRQEALHRMVEDECANGPGGDLCVCGRKKARNRWLCPTCGHKEGEEERKEQLKKELRRAREDRASQAKQRAEEKDKAERAIGKAAKAISFVRGPQAETLRAKLQMAKDLLNQGRYRAARQRAFDVKRTADRANLEKHLQKLAGMEVVRGQNGSYTLTARGRSLEGSELAFARYEEAIGRVRWSEADYHIRQLLKAAKREKSRYCLLRRLAAMERGLEGTGAARKAVTTAIQTAEQADSLASLQKVWDSLSSLQELVNEAKLAVMATRRQHRQGDDNGTTEASRRAKAAQQKVVAALIGETAESAAPPEPAEEEEAKAPPERQTAAPPEKTAVSPSSVADSPNDGGDQAEEASLEMAGQVMEARVKATQAMAPIMSTTIGKKGLEMLRQAATEPAVEAIKIYQEVIHMAEKEEAAPASSKKRSRRVGRPESSEEASRAPRQGQRKRGKPRSRAKQEARAAAHSS